MTRRRGAIVFSIVAVVVWTLAPVTAAAYWARNAPGTRMMMTLDVPASAFTAINTYGSTSFRALAERALGQWNVIGVGSKPDQGFFGTAPAVTTPVTDICSRPDGVNQVTFSDTFCGMTWGGAVAITNTWTNVATGRTFESDVLMNGTLTWNAYTGPLQTGVHDFYRIVAHEFGHVLGLDHPDDAGQSVIALMNAREGPADSPRDDDIAGAHAVAWNPDTPSMGATLTAAILPASRSARVGSAVTAFATIINSAGGTATNCRIAPDTAVLAPFTFQTTNPATNSTTGSPNTPVAIPAGSAQTFVIAFTATGPFAPSDVEFGFVCDNTDRAGTITGVNTLLLSGSSEPVADIVALVATTSHDGIVNIPGVTGTGAFAVASVNVGGGGFITATPDTGAAILPVSLAICQTNPASGACLAPPTPSVSTVINANETPTFAVFVAGLGGVAFAPGTNRVFVRFRDGAGVVRGATSVAIRTQ